MSATCCPLGNIVQRDYSTTGGDNRHLKSQKHTAMTIKETKKERLLVRGKSNKTSTKIILEIVELSSESEPSNEE